MPEITPDMYMSEEGAETSLTHEQREQNTHHRAAQNYARHANNTFEPEANDVELHSVLAKISRETNPLVRERLEAQANLLASGGVIKAQRSGGNRKTMPKLQTSDPTELNGDKSVMTTPYGILQSEVGRQALDGALDYCRNNLDAEAAEILNEDLTSNDIKVARKALKVALHMQTNKLRNFRPN